MVGDGKMNNKTGLQTPSGRGRKICGIIDKASLVFVIFIHNSSLFRDFIDEALKKGNFSNTFIYYKKNLKDYSSGSFLFLSASRLISCF